MERRQTSGRPQELRNKVVSSWVFFLSHISQTKQWRSQQPKNANECASVYPPSPRKTCWLQSKDQRGQPRKTENCWTITLLQPILQIKLQPHPHPHQQGQAGSLNLHPHEVIMRYSKPLPYPPSRVVSEIMELKIKSWL